MLLGNSASLLVRPHGSGVPYHRVLEQLLNEQSDDTWSVENISKVGGTVMDIRCQVESIVSTQPDVIIFHYGQAEGLPRTVSRRVWNLTFMRVPGLHPLVRRMRLIGWLYDRFRRSVNWRQHWVSLPQFERMLNDVLGYLHEETKAMIILVGATPNEVVEKIIPTSARQLARYNAVLGRVAGTHRASLLLPNEVLGAAPDGRPIEAFITDGSHFTGEGHTLLAHDLVRRMRRVITNAGPVALAGQAP